jgi:Leucine-rich repeat (LRR) protein
MPLLEEFRTTLSDVRAPLPAALGRLAHLRSLQLGSNPALAGSALPDLSGLRSLWSITAIQSGLTGALAGRLDGLVNLRAAALAGNAFSGAPPSLSGAWAARLRSLFLANNAIEGSADPFFARLAAEAPILEELDVSRNRLTGLVSGAGIAGHARLSVLSIAGNRITGPLPIELSTLATLRSISIARNPIREPLPSLAALPVLESLDASWCELSGALPASLPASLQRLVLEDNFFTSFAPPGAWESLRSLHTLLLARNAIAQPYTDFPRVLPTSTSPNVGLQIINLDGNRIYTPEVHTPSIYLDFSAFRAIKEVCGERKKKKKKKKRKKRKRKKKKTHGDSLSPFPPFPQVRLSDNNLQGVLWYISTIEDVPRLALIDVSSNLGIAGGVQPDLESLTLDLRNTSMTHNIFADGSIALHLAEANTTAPTADDARTIVNGSVEWERMRVRGAGGGYSPAF